jgi:hypothetical protein
VRVFTCPDCRHLVAFESTVCLNSSTELIFDWDARDFTALERPAACINRTAIGCNGAAGPGGLCASCALTRTRPNDDDPAGMAQWAGAEEAKRRLLFELLELGLPVDGYRERDGGLAFDLLSGTHAQITTGHADGIITLDLTEADPVARERTRVAMDEPYRTVLGHMRHEIGHYYQPLLAPEGSDARERCRELMGDDRADYEAALDRHHSAGPPADWQQQFISAYASTHPWEDWAETFSHYLHIRDVLQTAVAYGLTVAGPLIVFADTEPLYSYPGAAPEDFGAMLETWLPLTYALNAINRSLGAGDAYPFVITGPVADKLTFIDSLVAAPV